MKKITLLFILSFVSIGFWQVSAQSSPAIDVEASDLTVECDGSGNTTELNDWLDSIGTTGAVSNIFHSETIFFNVFHSEEIGRCTRCYN